MAPQNTDRHQTAFTMSVDAREGTTTGISASDRAKTIAKLIETGANNADFAQPGHIFPLKAAKGGVLARAGHTEAGVDLCRLANVYPAAVICEILNEDGEAATTPQLWELAKQHDIKMISIEALIRYRRGHEKLVERVTEARLPTAFGEFRAVAYESILDQTPYIALVKGEIRPDEPTLVRVHSGCLTGDALLSLRCDCGEQLHAAMNRINEEGRGFCCISASRRSRNWHHQQAARLRSTRQRRRYRTGQSRARFRGGYARIWNGRASSHRFRRAQNALAHQQPEETRRIGRLRFANRGARAATPDGELGKRVLSAHQTTENGAYGTFGYIGRTEIVSSFNTLAH
jgi:hypothetical protein